MFTKRCYVGLKNTEQFIFIDMALWMGWPCISLRISEDFRRGVYLDCLLSRILDKARFMVVFHNPPCEVDSLAYIILGTKYCVLKV